MILALDTRVRGAGTSFEHSLHVLTILPGPSADTPSPYIASVTLKVLDTFDSGSSYQQCYEAAYLSAQPNTPCLSNPIHHCHGLDRFCLYALRTPGAH